ncbi:hydantoinase B/oxoprolinase family protein [Verticiella sediminum]|uniref:Hydantoinase B/oxoprolinase family protein n=1 Tax=Verticiella sediminum TaxID=1247510 RepID=A0A556AZF8_9BURK|nr:hydantoinase B/oxoprolinase family protein [Verticiella sediminum]TSH98317.1 hydantoinase B/oxoprolinase family protein [Verticiella sediminum]
MTIPHDPTQLAILANAMHAIADEMGATLVRSAFSTIVREARDCACALLDAHGNVVAQAEMIPIHNGGLSLAFRESAAQLDLSGVGPEHAVLLNDPYAGGQHLNDLILFQPIFHEGELLGWAGNTAHHLDIGGGTGAGINIHANELIQEGIVIPPLLLDVRHDLYGGPLERMLFANVRTPDLGRGDFYAQLAANRTGIERMQDLAARVGGATLRAAMAETLTYAERRVRAAIAELPEGRWQGTAWIDNDVGGDEPLPVRVSVTVRDGGMTLDFEGTAPQVKSMFNSSLASSTAAAISAVRAILTDKDIPANDGCNRALDIRMPRGCILNPEPGLPVRARILASYRVLDAVHDALAQAVPERVPAQGFNSTTGLYLVQRRDGGRVRIYADVLGGGYGGAPDYDGAHALAGLLSSSRNTPIEAIEQIHPQLRMLHYRLVPDSAGAGRFRGGLGFSRAIEILEDGVELSFYSEHFRQPPRGKCHGADARKASLVVRRGDAVFSLRNPDVMRLAKGDIVELTVGGGAGWGLPGERAAEAVATDLADGLITPAFAREHYPHAARALS